PHAAGRAMYARIAAFGCLVHCERAAPADVSTPLERELAARMKGARTLTSVRYQAAKRRVRGRLAPEAAASPWPGRWSLVQRMAVMGKTPADDERAETLARVLLRRYGVLQRE